MKAPSGAQDSQSVRLDELNWAKTGGLLPAIVQDAQTGRVLMLGYMSLEALRKTLETGRVVFWSRRRKGLWMKGETSGNYLQLQEVREDCDGDALLLIARPYGPTCHRGTLSCFWENSEWNGLEFIGHLERVIQSRHQEMPEGSYTTALFNKGLSEIAKKVGEEAIEVVVSALQESGRSVEEVADLIYHLLVFLSQRGETLSEVALELKRRHFDSH